MMENKSNSCQMLLDFDCGMNSTYYHLNVIENDQKLLKENWTLHYAIDYCEIYRYAFYIYNITRQEIKNNLSEKIRNEFVSKYFATESLLDGFDEKEKIILLPPHIYELGFFISRMKSYSVKENLQLDRISENATFEENDILPIKKVIEILKEDREGNIPKKELKEAIQFLAKHYRELLFLKLAYAEVGIKKVKELLSGKEPRISFLEHLWPNSNELFTDLGEKEIIDSHWFLKFQQIRTKWCSDFYDAQALMMLKRLNEYLINNNQLILFYSDAATMTRVLNWDLLEKSHLSKNEMPRGVIKIPPLKREKLFFEYRLLRTPRTFLIRDMCTEKGKELLEVVKKKKEEIGKYFIEESKNIKDFEDFLERECSFYDKNIRRITKTNRHICRKCKQFKYENNRYRFIKRYEEIANQFENVHLYTSYAKKLKDREVNGYDVEVDMEKRMVNAVQEFASIIGNMSISNISFKKEIDKTKKRLEEEILSIRESLGEYAFASKSAFGVSREIYNMIQFVRIVDQINFKNKRINELSGLIKESIISICKSKRSYDAEADSKQVENFVNELIVISNSTRNECSEARLLKAILAYLFDELEYCREIIENEIEENEEIDKHNLEYLKCLTMARRGIRLNNKNIIKVAIEKSRELVNQYLDKPQFYYMENFIIIKAKEAGLVEDIDMMDMIKKSNKALEMDMGKYLRCDIINNKAYIIFLMGDNLDNISPQILIDIFNEMTVIVESVCNPCYFDSLGCLAFRIAQKIEEKANHKKLACNYLNEAKKLAIGLGYPMKEIELIQDHLNEVSS